LPKSPFGKPKKSKEDCRKLNLEKKKKFFFFYLHLGRKWKFKTLCGRFPGFFFSKIHVLQFLEWGNIKERNKTDKLKK